MLGIGFDELAGRGRKPEVVRARELLTVLGVERYGLLVKEIAAALHKHPVTATDLQGRSARDLQGTLTDLQGTLFFRAASGIPAGVQGDLDIQGLLQICTTDLQGTLFFRAARALLQGTLFFRALQGTLFFRAVSGIAGPDLQADSCSSPSSARDTVLSSSE